MQSKLAASFQNQKVFIVTDLQCLYILSIIRRTLCCGIPLIRHIMQFWSVYVFSYQHLKIYWVFCSDVDDCSAANNSCHGKAWCNNTQGSFTCSCKLGYEGDGYNCTGKILWVFWNLFKTIRLSLRGDWWHALKSVQERECVSTVTDYMIIIIILVAILTTCLFRQNKSNF